MFGKTLEGKSIILGVTGSIAAVKAVLIAKELQIAGAEVTVAITPNALQFAREEELWHIAEGRVITQVFREKNSRGTVAPKSADGPDTWHVHAGRDADAMLIAPCSASTIGKLRVGIYDNPVTLLAASLPIGTPLALAPAMDEDMWLQAAVQDSLGWLKQNGTHVIGPVSGRLASGLTGMGRMVEPEEIVRQLEKLLTTNNLLQGKRVLITGGPTYEPIDPVRFIGNRSTGKMAYALATVARRMGADVTLIMGPTAISTNGVSKRIDVETADEMLAAVRNEFNTADIIIMSAAVSDFTPVTASNTKLKKREKATTNIELQPTTDILAEIGRTKRNGQIVVGFALEKGEGAEEYARAKLLEKNLDMIVLNDIAQEGAGFGYDTNKITIFTRGTVTKTKSRKKEEGQRYELPLLSKDECARRIFEHILQLT